MLPSDPAVWALANEMRDLVRPEEAYECAERHLKAARAEGWAEGYNDAYKEVESRR